MSSKMITLGIGTPGDIQEFILVGLSPAIIISSELTIYDRSTTLTLQERDIDLTLYDRFNEEDE